MASLSRQVAAGNDDARQVAGVMYLDETTGIIMPANTPGAWAATRFTNITIPPGSTIGTPTTYSVYVYTSSNDSPDLDALADDADDSAQPTTTANDLSNRVLTTAKVTWTATNIGTGWKSPGDVAAVIQEIIDRPGWASGNAITILLDARTTSNDFRFRCYENDPLLAAKLDITYTPPAGGGVAVKMAHYRRLRS